MGLETELRKEVRMTKVRSVILTSLKVGGLVAMTVIAPKVAGLLGKAYSRAERKKTYTALQRLHHQKLVTFKKGSAQITARGLRYLAMNMTQSKPLRWDNKWRIVVFDIPERRRHLRDALRDSLIRIGFTPLQRSTWIYPYDCEELISLLKTNYRIGSEVIYVIADKVENDRKFRSMFNL